MMHQWRPSEHGTYKVNFDAAVIKSLNSAGIGVIIRDWGGQPSGALSMSMLLANSVSKMEALACRRAIQFTVDLDLHRVIFEGDSAIVINAVSQENAALSSYGFIVEDILSLVSSFLSFEFVHVPCSGNIVADALAKKAKELVGCQVWSAVMPAENLTLPFWWILMFINYLFLIYAQTEGLVSGKKKNSFPKYET